MFLLLLVGGAAALLWPVVVALALAGLEHFAAQGAGLLILAAVVGAGLPLPLMGWLVVLLI